MTFEDLRRHRLNQIDKDRAEFEKEVDEYVKYFDELSTKSAEELQSIVKDKHTNPRRNNMAEALRELILKGEVGKLMGTLLSEACKKALYKRCENGLTDWGRGISFAEGKLFTE